MASKSSYNITVSEPRTTIRVTMASGTVLEAAIGTPIQAILEADAQLNPDRYPVLAIAGILNGRLRELAYPINHDSQLAPILLSDSDGGRIYRRSLTLLLATAIDECFPGVKVGVQYAVPEGGFYCELRNRKPFNADELKQLQAHMEHIVQADDVIHKSVVPLKEALSVFEKRNADDKLRLLQQRERNDLTVYTLRQRTDYYFGYMVPSTRYLNQFALTPVGDGFVLQYPRSEAPNTLQSIPARAKLTDVFHQTNEWLQLMGVEDIGHLNAITRDSRTPELILVAEALHDMRIGQIAAQINRRYRQEGVRIVLIAGPSSSGKTTFAKRLAVQLLAHGIRPFTLELDNYFVDRDQNPRDENGDYDFETLEALRVAFFNEQLNQLIRGEPVRIPRFDFITGKGTPHYDAQLNDNQLIIIEGIHGLNPGLVPQIAPEIIHRVYVSALTALNVDAHNRVPTTDVRLIRRIVRDANHRGYNATETLKRWASVRRGEKRNIFPYQENANAMFNSALVYELAALRPQAEPLLLQVEPNTQPHLEANRLLSFLGWVHPLSEQQIMTIPGTSLLREFIGGSRLEHYQPDTLSG